ncbi:hypothetical protein QBC37DRAFT_404359 [Rhypophila decipiens]|uniref:Wax synthase domain-containing protein n=1 Tax=Rhypophila decipiens TaxID=261697 RepID=A0AAN6XYR4_9PEZI|nr:hypothetical protein QBC37DRAFT_404359 [Rhypophila decipiens]
MANSTLSTRGILPVDPTSPAPADALSILPHILLFIVLLLAFYPPPFRFRGSIICTLVALLDWRSTVSLWPPNLDDTRPFKYGIASSWIFVLPVLQRVLIQLPEKDFWRLDEEEVVFSELREDDGPVPVKTHRPSPREWSWKKLRWSISLFATPRAVGWNFGSRKMNAQREEIRRARLALSDTPAGGAACKTDDEMVKIKLQFPRAQFVVVKLFRAFACYLVWDLVAVANRRVIVPRGEEWWSWHPEIMAKILWLEILMGITVYVGMNMQFDVAAAIGVGLRLNEPEDWPPLFGSITDCYTIANVWGKFWHQYMRQPCLGTSHFLLAHLNLLISRLPRRLHIFQIPKHSLVAYLFHLLTAFAISTFFHALSVGTVAVGVTPVRGIIKDMAIFFMIQPFAAAFESFISTCYDKFVVARLLRSKLAAGRNVKQPGTAVSDGSGHDDHTIAPTTTNSTAKTDTGLVPSRHIIEETEATCSGQETDANKDTERSQRRRMSVVFWSAVFGRMVGYVWVLFWFYLTGQWFIRPYIDVGMVEWGLPFSFADWLLLAEGCR